MSAPLTQTQMLLELEPVVEANLNRHLSMAKEWFPHEYVPWSDGRNFDGPLNGEAWSVEDVTRPAEHRLYRATATGHSILDKSVSGVDRRTPVDP